jgi:hypothetical protein
LRGPSHPLPGASSRGSVFTLPSAAIARSIAHATTRSPLAARHPWLAHLRVFFAVGGRREGGFSREPAVQSGWRNSRGGPEGAGARFWWCKGLPSTVPSSTSAPKARVPHFCGPKRSGWSRVRNLTFILLLGCKGKWVGPARNLTFTLLLWRKGKWVVLGEELDLHPFPARTLSLSGAFALL